MSSLSLSVSRGMNPEFEAMVEERLSVFEEEPDLNDWVEIFSGAAMAVIGIYYLVYPASFLSEEIMRWFAAIVISVGAVWAGHGLKDMAIKENRRSMVMLELSKKRKTVDYGLIRDVLLHPNQYKGFLMEAYEQAFSDGILTDAELSELKEIQEALDITDEQAGALATRAAINVALRDGSVDDNELELIMKAAKSAGLKKKEIEGIVKALEDGKIDSEEKVMLESLLEGNKSEEDSQDEE